MRSWPTATGLKKYGEHKTARLLNNHYQGLATWLEYYLLNKKELYNQLFSNDGPLIYLKPHADLVAASHDFIDRHLFPRINWLWESLAPTSDVLWGLFEYSWCHSSFQTIIKGTNEKSKPEMLKALGEATTTRLEWLEAVDGIQQKLIAGAVVAQALPGGKQEKLNRLRHIQELLQEVKGNPQINLHKLTLLQAELLICCGERSLVKPYEEFLGKRETYRKAVKLLKQLQIVYLPDPEDDPVFSKKGQRIPSRKGVDVNDKPLKGER